MELVASVTMVRQDLMTFALQLNWESEGAVGGVNKTQWSEVKHDAHLLMLNEES